MINGLDNLYTDLNNLTNINCDSIECTTFLDQDANFFKGITSNLQTQINNISNNPQINYVSLEGDQVINGIKRFTSSPIFSGVSIEQGSILITSIDDFELTNFVNNVISTYDLTSLITNVISANDLIINSTYTFNLPPILSGSRIHANSIPLSAIAGLNLNYIRKNVAQTMTGILTFSENPIFNDNAIPTTAISGLDGLIGQQGPQGPQGIQGIQGPQGIQGEKGDGYSITDLTNLLLETFVARTELSDLFEGIINTLYVVTFEPKINELFDKNSQQDSTISDVQIDLTSLSNNLTSVTNNLSNQINTIIDKNIEQDSGIVTLASNIVTVGNQIIDLFDKYTQQNLSITNLGGKTQYITTDTVTETTNFSGNINSPGNISGNNIIMTGNISQW